MRPRMWGTRPRPSRTLPCLFRAAFGRPFSLRDAGRATDPRKGEQPIERRVPARGADVVEPSPRAPGASAVHNIMIGRSRETGGRCRGQGPRRPHPEHGWTTCALRADYARMQPPCSPPAAQGGMRAEGNAERPVRARTCPNLDFIIRRLDTAPGPCQRGGQSLAYPLLPFRQFHPPCASCGPIRLNLRNRRRAAARAAVRTAATHDDPALPLPVSFFARAPRIIRPIHVIKIPPQIRAGRQSVTQRAKKDAFTPFPPLPFPKGAGRSAFSLAGVAQLAEQLICNQPVAGSSPIASSTVEGFPSGQREQTVNLSS